MTESKKRFYTLIGSRETPDDILSLMSDLAIKLDEEGYTVRSGGANGADSSANVANKKEIYLPWNGFNGHQRDIRDGYIVYSDLKLNHIADTHASLHHQWWETTKKESVRHLHRRNMFQVLGKDLKTLSHFLICYAKPDEKRGEGHVQGGTGSAVSLALSKGVEVYNLYYEKEASMMIRWLEKEIEV